MSLVLRDGRVRWSGWTRWVVFILAANLLAYMALLVLGGRAPEARDWVMNHLALSRPELWAGAWWQLLTYMWLHSDQMWFHIAINLLAIGLLGPEVERMLGPRHFVAMYLITGVLGGLAFVLTNAFQVCVGASGALCGIFGALIGLAPSRKAVIMPMRWRIPVWWIGLLVLLSQLVLFLYAQDSHVAYSVHIAGGIAGYVYGTVLLRRYQADMRRLERAL